MLTESKLLGFHDDFLKVCLECFDAVGWVTCKKPNVGKLVVVIGLDLCSCRYHHSHVRLEWF